MSFFERAKAAASDLAAKADAEMKKAGISTPGAGVPGAAGGSGAGDRALRDLGVLAYLEATGRPAPGADRARLVEVLRGLEASGQLGPLTVAPAPYGSPGSPPPPPGAAAAASAPPPPPPPPPPSDAGSPPPPPPPPPHEAPPGSTPPPPPPSWA